jgi:hypothetical protein
VVTESYRDLTNTFHFPQDKYSHEDLTTVLPLATSSRTKITTILYTTLHTFFTQLSTSTLEIKIDSVPTHCFIDADIVPTQCPTQCAIRVSALLPTLSHRLKPTSTVTGGARHRHQSSLHPIWRQSKKLLKERLQQLWKVSNSPQLSPTSKPIPHCGTGSTFLSMTSGTFEEFLPLRNALVVS